MYLTLLWQGLSIQRQEFNDITPPISHMAC
jgi:hypothetical protein